MLSRRGRTGGARQLLRDLRDAYAEGEQRDTAAWRLDMAAQCMDDAAIHTIDAWCQRMLREHAFDSGNLFDETLEADESQRQTEAAQDYWRQQCYPLSGEVLEAALQVWPDVQALVKDMQSLLRENVPLRRAPGPGRMHCADTGERAQLQALAMAGSKSAALEDWLDGQMAAQRLEQAQAASLLLQGLAGLRPGRRAARWAGGWRRRAPPAWSCRAGRGLQGLDGGAAAPNLPSWSSCLQALAQLPSLHVALRLHAAVHVQQRLLWLKRQAGTFGFADMLQRLDAALAGDNGPALQAGILAQYPVALIDEFQDTSPLQYRLFDQIYRTADNSADSALLLIGDPKQSIYGFRGADIYSYLQAAGDRGPPLCAGHQLPLHRGAGRCGQPMVCAG
jgi:exodeoxyribonuclease V beta subunit